MWFLAVLHIYKTFLRSIQWCILSFKHFEMSHIVHFISINHLQNLSYVHISPDLICFSLLLQRKVRPSRWSKHAYGRVWSAPSRSLSSSVWCLSQPIRCFAVVWSNRMDQSQRRSNSTYNSDTNGKKKKNMHTQTGAAEKLILFKWNPNVVTEIFLRWATASLERIIHIWQQM